MSQCRHQPVFRRGRSEYGWIYPVRGREKKLVSQTQIKTRRIGVSLHWRILTKREELSLRTVFALPYASRTGLVWTTCSSRVPFFTFSPGAGSSFLVEAPTVAKYAMTFFVFSVLPAPDSPLWAGNDICKFESQNDSHRATVNNTVSDTSKGGNDTYVISIDWFSRSVGIKRRESWWDFEQKANNTLDNFGGNLLVSMLT